jgi:hypothetical protein
MKYPVLSLLLLSAALGACSSSQEAAQASADEPPAARSRDDVLDRWAREARAQQQARAAEKPRPGACELVTPAEMGRILGTPVTGSGNQPFSNQTVCDYDSADGNTRVSFQVNWGDGAAAAVGMQAADRAEPGLAPSADGLGDGYRQIGPMLMIRAGGDLVQLQMTGVDDVHAAARRMLAIARPRMSAPL